MSKYVFNSSLNEIIKKKKCLNQTSKRVKDEILAGMLYNTRNKVIKLFNDYSATAFEDNCLGHMLIT